MQATLGAELSALHLDGLAQGDTALLLQYLMFPKYHYVAQTHPFLYPACQRKQYPPSLSARKQLSTLRVSVVFVAR